MQLNFLGKAFIASVGGYAASKIIESLVEEDEVPASVPPATTPPSRPYSGQELLDMVDNHGKGLLAHAAIVLEDWNVFNRMIEGSQIRAANYEQRCEVWTLLRSL